MSIQYIAVVEYVQQNPEVGARTTGERTHIGVGAAPLAARGASPASGATKPPCNLSLPRSVQGRSHVPTIQINSCVPCVSYSPPVLQLIVKRRAGGARNFVEKGNLREDPILPLPFTLISLPEKKI